MALDFITDDPAGQGFDAGTKRMDQFVKRQRDLDLDTAIRTGVSDSLNQQGGGDRFDTPYQAPTTTPAAYQPSKIATPDTSAAPAPAQRSPGTLASFGSPASADFQTRIGHQESGANLDPGAVNPTSGYRFRYGFGKAALADAGVYQPIANENLNDPHGASWPGAFKVPGYGTMNYQQFAGNGDAQDAAFTAHMNNVDRQIVARPAVAGAIGQDVPGLPGLKIDEDKLRAMVQAGGARGTEEYLASNGASDPHQITAYLAKLYGVQPGAPPGVRPNGNPGAPGYAVPAATPGGNFMPGASAQRPGSFGLPTTSRYDPVLAQLAGTPGGGAEALKLMTAQGKFDTQNFQRFTQASRLALTALSRGDVESAKYFANYAGIPTEGNPAFQPGANGKLFGQTGLMTQRLYGAGTPEGGAFMQAFMQRYRENGGDAGDASQVAFQAAGPPRGKPSTTIRQVWDEAGQAGFQVIDRNTATATPVTTQGGAPLTSAAPPSRAGIKLVPVRQQDGSELLYQQHADGTMTPALDENNQPMVRAARTPSQQVTLDHKIALFKQVGLSDADALSAATGHPTPSVTPASIVSLYGRLKASADANDNPLQGETPQAHEARKQAGIEQSMDNLFSGWDWRSALRGGGSYRAPAAQPAPPGASLPTALTDTPANAPRPAAPATAQAPAAAPAAGPRGTSPQDAIRVTDPAEAQSLPPGTWFLAPDGVPRRRKAPAPVAAAPPDVPH